MEYICKICNCEIEGNSHFWENHHQKISNYFEQYEPRRTIDGKKLEFRKNIESYFEIIGVWTRMHAKRHMHSCPIRSSFIWTKLHAALSKLQKLLTQR